MLSIVGEAPRIALRSTFTVQGRIDDWSLPCSALSIVSREEEAAFMERQMAAKEKQEQKAV